MTFLKRYKALIGLAAAFVLLAGGAHLAGWPGCAGGNCPITAIFGTSSAYAGPGCGAAKAEGSSCSATTNAQTASAKTCTKEECISKLMAEKKLTREQAEAAYAECSSMKASGKMASGSCCTSHGSAMTASATTTEAIPASAASGCSGHANASMAVATSADSKSVAADKETCIAKCMAEKGMTRAEAEACYSKCQSAKADGKSCAAGAGVNMIQTAAATDGKHSREACIDACIAKGMSRADAEAAATKCEAAGFHTAVATEMTGDKAATCPHAAKTAEAGAKGTCCSKAKGSASATTTTTETPAAATQTSSGGSN